MRTILLQLRVLPLLLAALAPALSGADTAPSARQQAVHQAATAAQAALVRGPASLPLSDQATLKLPEGFGFVPRKEAFALMRAMGNSPGQSFLGLITPLGGAAGWFVTVNYESSGYIKDDDARHWDAQKLLQSLKDGTEAANAERVKMGVPALEVTRWIEPPAYQSASHELVWSAEARHKDGADTDPVVNYNTYLLGREGYLSLNLITSASAVESDKAAAHKLLAAVDFNSGKRYADFNSSTDKVAAYGLAALVAGVAAKKLGLLALLAATVVKFAKVFIVAGAAALMGIRRWLGMRAGKQA